MAEKWLQWGFNRKVGQGNKSNRIYERDYLILQKFCFDNGLMFLYETRKIENAYTRKPRVGS